MLTDVHDGRLHLGERNIPLAQPVRTRLAAYLEERTRRWPNTANPHFFINCTTATDLGPTSNIWATKVLGISAQAIREDRIVHELLATGDLRHLVDLFGLTISGAYRYLAALDPSSTRKPNEAGGGCSTPPIMRIRVIAGAPPAAGLIVNPSRP
ncbi:hypothetical protein ACIO3O_40160 [Streptomyces sp. NPDC087440]|uniref:hypothetical protein n=1 Tax=Streptomyces sp. NPDC087440 TaxID=3365790 RepID=UPI00381528E7